VDELRVCRDCEVALPASSFGRDSHAPEGLNRRCRPCVAERNRQYRSNNPDKVREANRRWRAANVERRKVTDRAWRERNPQRVRSMRRTDTARKYGLTPESYSALFDSQGRACAICRTTEPLRGQWCVDHDHGCCTGTRRTCGECVRGILCGPCNQGLGLFADDAGRLESAIKYLSQQWKEVAA
jgi:hypothetical protein